MALLWADGFDRYTVASGIGLNYSGGGQSTVSVTGGYNNGGYFSIFAGGQGSNSSNFTRTFNTASALVIGGEVHFMWIFKNATRPSGTISAIRFGTNIVAVGSGNAPSIMVNSAGALSVNMHNAATVLATSADNVIASTTTWYIVEYAARWNTSGNGGYVKVWVNGNLVINFAGTTQSGTVPTTWTGVYMGYQSGDNQVNLQYDDWIAWDELGSDWVYTQLSASYLPFIETDSMSADDVVQFVPLASTNVSQISDATFHDSDTTYNASTAIGAQDTFAPVAQSGTPTVTFGIVVHAVAKLNVAGIANAKTVLTSNAVTVNSAALALTTTYQHMWAGYGKDPGTGLAWVTNQQPNIKVGYKYDS